ncbi:hypothetical protein QBC35DRAFT_345590, partial [Podospora australis]
RPCGFKIAPCPTGYVCQNLDPGCKRGENCQGVCLRQSGFTATVLATATATRKIITTTTKKPPTPTFQSCGGFRVNPYTCPKGQICVDNPYVEGCGMACDKPGICVDAAAAQFCGGFAGFQCRDGKLCIDDPRDDCDPWNGGADCGGICV